MMLAVLAVAVVASGATALIAAIAFVDAYDGPVGRRRTLGLWGWGLVGVGAVVQLVLLIVYGGRW
jgi:hypothetical protein